MPKVQKGKRGKKKKKKSKNRERDSRSRRSSRWSNKDSKLDFGDPAWTSSDSSESSSSSSSASSSSSSKSSKKSSQRSSSRSTSHTTTDSEGNKVHHYHRRHHKPHHHHRKKKKHKKHGPQEEGRGKDVKRTLIAIGIFAIATIIAYFLAANTTDSPARTCSEFTGADRVICVQRVTPIVMASQIKWLTVFSVIYLVIGLWKFNHRWTPVSAGFAVAGVVTLGYAVYLVFAYQTTENSRTSSMGVVLSGLVGLAVLTWIGHHVGAGKSGFGHRRD